MVDIIYSPEFDSLFRTLFPDMVHRPLAAATHKPACKCFNAPASKYFPTISSIPVSRVIYSGNTTTVYFTDGTKTSVKCSSHDTYDRQTAIAYALVKRLFGKIGRYDSKTKKFYANEIDGNGLGTKLEKIAANGFDQDLEAMTKAEKKETAKAAHLARQKAESEAAWNRKVQKRAEELRLEREASALADSLSKSSSKKLLDETSSHSIKKETSKDSWQFYKKPNKPFSKFTEAEKKEYWRAHSAKRRAFGK